MFAVKGWSVDTASLKPDTEVAKSKQSKDGNSSKKNKKRKRVEATNEDSNRDVESVEVDKLWRQHVEGEQHAKKRKKERKRDRREPREEKVERKANGSVKELKKSKDKAKAEANGVPDIVDHNEGEEPRKTKNSKRKNRQDTKEGISKHAANGSEPTPNAQDQTVHAGPQVRNNHAKVSMTLPPANTTLTPMQSAMRQKLTSARFRHLNQTLYTEPSSKALQLFADNPATFEDYHAGFRQQVEAWPENPLDKFIAAIRQRAKIKPPSKVDAHRRKGNAQSAKPPTDDDGKALPRTNGTATVADLGCGDARLARTLTESGDAKRLNLNIQSFDLHSNSDYVTQADISNLPLKDRSVDVALFCLALMGTNWVDFVEEAFRVLRWKGELWVAEIKSRFGRVGKGGKVVGHSVGSKRKQLPPTKAQQAKTGEQEEVGEQEALEQVVDGVPVVKEETDVSAFVSVLKRRGFILKAPQEQAVDLSNRMFVKMEFVKYVDPVKGKGKVESDARNESRGDGRGGLVGAGKQKLKFFDDGEADMDSEVEREVLKPCLYKIR